MAKLLVIDNYDSFTYNLVQMFMNYDLAIRVYRSDKIDVEGINAALPDYILISPGPKDPAHAGVSTAVIRSFYQTVPILGVCLGMQCINEVFGGQTIRSDLPVHGKTSMVVHDEKGIFGKIPSPFEAARYHSLVVKPDQRALKKDLIITARTTEGVIMGLSHKKFPLHGVQFHPESFLTAFGFILVENFLKLGPLKDSLPRTQTAHWGHDYIPEKALDSSMMEAGCA